MSKIKPMLIGNHTYGNYNPELKSFWCTHGAWKGEVKFIDDKTLQLFSGKMAEIVDYQFIDKIPEDYNYTQESIMRKEAVLKRKNGSRVKIVTEYFTERYIRGELLQDKCVHL